MDIPICGGGKLTLEDGTLGTFADKYGNIVAVLIVSGDCWSEDAANEVRVELAPGDPYVESETTVTSVPAGCAGKKIVTSQAVKVCRNQSGEVVRCPPR